MNLILEFRNLVTGQLEDLSSKVQMILKFIQIKITVSKPYVHSQIVHVCCSIHEHLTSTLISFVHKNTCMFYFLNATLNSIQLNVTMRKLLMHSIYPFRFTSGSFTGLNKTNIIQNHSTIYKN